MGQTRACSGGQPAMVELRLESRTPASKPEALTAVPKSVLSLGSLHLRGKTICLNSRKVQLGRSDCILLPPHVRCVVSTHRTCTVQSRGREHWLILVWGWRRLASWGRISSHCQRKWPPSGPATSPSLSGPVATLKGHPAGPMRALSSFRVIKGKYIFGRKVPPAPWESPVAGWTTGYPRGS